MHKQYVYKMIIAFYLFVDTSCFSIKKTFSFSLSIPGSSPLIMNQLSNKKELAGESII